MVSYPREGEEIYPPQVVQKKGGHLHLKEGGNRWIAKARTFRDVYTHAPPNPDKLLTFGSKGLIKAKKERRMKEKVERVLNERIRPALQANGGDVELVDVEGGVVKVKLLGRCEGCPFSTMTIKMGVERILKEEIPEVERVEAL